MIVLGIDVMPGLLLSAENVLLVSPIIGRCFTKHFNINY